MSPVVFIVPEARHGEAARLFAACFGEDAGVHMAMGGKDNRAHWFAALIGVLVQGGGIVLGVEREGALAGLLLLDSGGSVNHGGQVAAMVKLAMTAGPGGLWRLARHDQLRRRTMRGKRAVVEFVAVHPEARGGGVARALFAEAERRANGRGLWLDTVKAENVAIFSAFGFEAVATFTDGGVAFTAMEKEEAG